MKTKQRTLAVLLVLVLVLGGLLWVVSRSNAAEEAASSAAAEGSILLSSFAAGDVTSIRYAYGGETLTLNYDSGSWTLADDPGYHLDASACNTMVTALASLNAKRQLAAQPGEDYGLADPAVTVTVTAAGKTNTFAFGSQNPVTGDLYVQKTGDETIIAAQRQQCLVVGVEPFQFLLPLCPKARGQNNGAAPARLPHRCDQRRRNAGLAHTHLISQQGRALARPDTAR